MRAGAITTTPHTLTLHTSFSVALDTQVPPTSALASCSLSYPSLQLGFARPRQFQRVSSLSGGERRRLHLASVLIEKPNLLILDEPTNDLDLQTVEVSSRSKLPWELMCTLGLLLPLQCFITVHTV